MVNKVRRKHPPRMRITEEEFSAFLDALSKGLPVTVALTHTSWAHSSYYYRLKSDRKFAAKVNAAKALWYNTLGTSNFGLVKDGHAETVKHNVKRMDRDVARHDYRDALIAAQKKAISELDFERAEILQKKIDESS